MPSFSKIISALLSKTKLPEHLTVQSSPGFEDAASKRSTEQINNLTDPKPYFLRADLIWSIMILSLPIDLCLVRLAQSSQNSTALIEYAIYCCVLLAMLGLNSEWLLSLGDKLRSKENRSHAIYKALIPILLLALLALAKVIYQVSMFGLGPLLLLLAIFCLSLPKQINTLKSIKERVLQLERDPVLLLKQINIQVLMISLIPIVAARAISILAVIRAQTSLDGLNGYLPFGILSLVILLKLRPKHELFTCKCLRCAAWTARATKYLGYCPSCATDRFSVSETLEDTALPFMDLEAHLPKTEKKDVSLAI